MEFSHNFANPMETSRPSVFGQSNIGAASAVPWVHTPPTHMPWRIDQPSLVHFTGGHSIDHGHINDGFCGNLHYAHVKRKIDAEAEIMPAVKVHITDDKMAAHMSQLRIGPNYAPPSSSMEIAPIPISSSKDIADDLEKIKEKQELKKLVICEEIRSLKNDLNVLPSALLSKIGRPSMALVLWQPPSGILGQPLQNAVDIARGEEEPDNNNSTLLDLNTFRPIEPHRSDQAGPSTSRTDPEAMDL